MYYLEADNWDTHNSTNSQRERCSGKQDTESTFSDEFLAWVSETSQATMDDSKYESKEQHYHLHKRV